MKALPILTIIQYIICLLFLVSGTIIHAAPPNDLPSLKKYITDFAHKTIQKNEDEDIQVDILNLNEQFTLPTCSAEIHPRFVREDVPTENNTIELSCATPQRWNVFIPIQVRVYSKVLAARHYIPSGTIVTENDVFFAKHDKKVLRDGYFKSLSDVIGHTSLHAIPSGGAFSPKNVKQPALVKRNQTIKLVLNQGGVSVGMRGIAKSNGILNQTIKVMNPSSKKILEAVVTGPNRAQINE